MSLKNSWLQSNYQGNFQETFVFGEKCSRNNDLTGTRFPRNFVLGMYLILKKYIFIFLCAKTFEFQIFKRPPILFSNFKKAPILF